MVYLIVFTVLIINIFTVWPGIDILPLPTEFLALLNQIFALIRMVREWPIISEVIKGFNIYLWFLVFKISWNTFIFIVSRVKDLDGLKKLTI